MMKLIYDYQCFVQRVGGVSRFHVELLRNFSEDVQWSLPPMLSDNEYLPLVGIPKHYPFPNIHSGFKENVYKQISQWSSLVAIKRGNYDVFHATGMNPYFVGHTKKPVVITVHDLIHEKYPEIMPKAELVKAKRKKQLDRADAITCISEETKMDLLRYHNIDEKKISVIYHGADQTLADKNTVPIFPFPYVLYVGGRNYYKNFRRFATAFSRLNKDLHLVCSGSNINNDERALFEQLGISDRVHHLFATEEQLENMFAHAVAFVYPSESEGFGLPILEAFRSGCPCIISDIRCFHEVAADAAVYFEPLSTDSMTDALEKSLTDAALLTSLMKKGYERMKAFTWSETARKYELVYKTLA